MLTFHISYKILFLVLFLLLVARSLKLTFFVWFHKKFSSPFRANWSSCSVASWSPSRNVQRVPHYPSWSSTHASKNGCKSLACAKSPWKWVVYKICVIYFFLRNWYQLYIYLLTVIQICSIDIYFEERTKEFSLLIWICPCEIYFWFIIGSFEFLF